MQAASKPSKKRRNASGRVTLTLSAESFRKLDELRGEKARSVWVHDLIEREERARGRRLFAETLAVQYTPEVCRETLNMHDEFPTHER